MQAAVFPTFKSLEAIHETRELVQSEPAVRMSQFLDSPMTRFIVALVLLPSRHALAIAGFCCRELSLKTLMLRGFFQPCHDWDIMLRELRSGVMDRLRAGELLIS